MSTPNRRIGVRQPMNGRTVDVWSEHRGRFGRRRLEPRTGTLVDLSVSGARLEVPPDVEVRRGQTVEIELGGERCNVRLVDVVPNGQAGPTLLRVEFVGAQPAFLSRVTEWLGDTSLKPSEMRD